MHENGLSLNFIMAVTPIPIAADVLSQRGYTGRDSLMKQCHYSHRWGQVMSTCYRQLKVCFVCHRPVHYIATCAWKSRLLAQVAAMQLFGPPRCWGGNNHARECWKRDRTGSSSSQPFHAFTEPLLSRATLFAGSGNIKSVDTGAI